MNFHEVGQIHLCVDLRGRQRGVAEELLNRPEVHSSLEEVGCESVPQRVRVKVVDISSSANRTVELTTN